MATKHRYPFVSVAGKYVGCGCTRNATNEEAMRQFRFGPNLYRWCPRCYDWLSGRMQARLASNAKRGGRVELTPLPEVK